MSHVVELKDSRESKSMASEEDESLAQGDLSESGDARFLSFLPGQRLRKARELRKLTVAQVSEQLRLSLAYIDALETDRYERLPEPAFVRGYLRSYARLLNLSADDVISKYDQYLNNVSGKQQALPDSPVQLLDRLSGQTVRYGRRMLWIASAVFIVVFFVVGVMGYGLMRHSRDAEPVVPDASVLPEKEVVMEAGDGLVLPAPTQATAESVPVAAVPSIPAAAAPVAAVPVAGAPAIAAPVVQSAAAPAVAAAPLAATAKVVFRVSDASAWIRISDASGQLLHEALDRKGAVVPVSGKAPFSIMIGDASVVSVEFNGRAVDLTPYMSGKVATLKLQ